MSKSPQKKDGPKNGSEGSRSFLDAAAPKFSPREFLKSRRPERFSDSAVKATPALARRMLEYHLETLTSRSQQRDFERFARRLAEREICPNLSPQTGPTGGGDSGVDTETYPVSRELTSTWYVGSDGSSATERWAFAFSAKKRWRAKVREDIAKIAETQRGYTKAFFISNQFIRDRTRAEFEDELSRKHQLDVRILDRTWIVEKVVLGGHEQIAVNELGLSGETTIEVRQGPRDLERQRDLDEVEKRISSAPQGGGLGAGFVDDCLEAATLARGLERPRMEVDSRFLRAKRAAKELGMLHQRVDASYAHAWTTYWWFEDYHGFAELYKEVENQVAESTVTHHWELVYNLWNLLVTSVRRDCLTEEQADLKGRTGRLVKNLRVLGAEEGRPSNSLLARTLRIQMEITLAQEASQVDAGL